MSAAPDCCFHCGEPLAGRLRLPARLQDEEALFCCHGCQAAAQLIAQLGLADFYVYRSAPSLRPVEVAGEWRAFDEPDMVATLTRGAAGARSVVLLIDGLTCAACSWLVTRALLQLPGVARATVNAATGRARITWDQTRVPLSQLLACIAALGYRPRPMTADTVTRQAEEERNRMLKRTVVAGLGMMQVMMFAVALYSGNTHGMDPQMRIYLRGVSLLVATPVMLYAGWPFFTGAVRALSQRGVSMDVPVSLGLLLAYGASVFNTWRHAGEVYFDSVTMFIFFLTIARFVEMVARHRSNDVGDALSRLLPVTAHRYRATAAGEAAAGEALVDVAVSQLRPGDRVLVRAGEVVPADGEILGGSTRINESMLTGEALAVERREGDLLSAGTINEGAPVSVRVTATGAATVLAHIVALLGRAQAERPRLTRSADAFASRFLIGVLVAAGLVGMTWYCVDSSRAFAAVLAVLVAACPCALSLATVVTVASANAALARRGVLVTHPDAIEGLARLDRVIFDKTGTLTSGEVRVTGVEVYGASDRQACLDLAAALEQASEHPLGRSFRALSLAPPAATDMRVVPGGGLEGRVGGARYRIGARAFVLAGMTEAARHAAPAAGDADIYLGSDAGVLATFALDDALRGDALATVRALQDAGLEVELSSGDSVAAVSRVAGLCGIGAYAARQSPTDKLRRAVALRATGSWLAMVGDGINDAPVLGGSAVAIAMGRGSALAQASADLILVGDRLQALPEAIGVARRAQRIMRQNLIWAAAYNLTAMPLAALGWVPPWAAAIGMSLSSILVVLNGMRALTVPAAATCDAGPARPPSLARLARSTA